MSHLTEATASTPITDAPVPTWQAVAEQQRLDYERRRIRLTGPKKDIAAGVALLTRLFEESKAIAHDTEPPDPYQAEQDGMVFAAYANAHDVSQAEQGRGLAANFEVAGQDPGSSTAVFDWSEPPACGFRQQGRFQPCRYPRTGFWRCARCFLEKAAKSRLSQTGLAWYGPVFEYDRDGDFGCWYKSRMVGDYRAHVVRIPPRAGRPAKWVLVQTEDYGLETVTIKRDDGSVDRKYTRQDIRVVAYRDVHSLNEGIDAADRISREWAAAREYLYSGWDSGPGDPVDGDTWLRQNDPHYEELFRANARGRSVSSRTDDGHMDEMTSTFSPSFLESVVEEGYGFTL